ncbi:Putative adhesin [Alkalibacterium subtropicum]|uniref:Putative adhesin n=1 Tax=Alkalibacterium subtropicum TaxID=753702 RepID=A0A1I1I4E4_9LACT|nr:daptomycin-sensing surface protein LiaX [Alkalibacterium subtropicum]SFC28563.1 Putative adhesin [Alkalibacterium subtropicum]
MNERERIIDLMKKGILSTEEGLDLLENTISKEGRKVEEEEFTDEAAGNVETEEAGEEAADKETAQAQNEAEAELEALVKEINACSVRLDTLNQQLSEVDAELNEKNTELNQLTKDSQSDITERKEAISEEIRLVQKELELIKQLDEVDNTDEIVSLRNKIDQLSKELEQVEMTEQDFEDDSHIQELGSDISKLEDKKTELSREKEECVKQLNRSKVRQWTLKAKQATASFEIPEDWKKEASEELTKAGKRIEEAGKEMSSLFKKTVNQASDKDMKQTIRTSFDNVLENFDWKNVSLKFPTLASKEYSKEWSFDDSTATIIDIKVANGKITVNKGNNETIALSAKGKLYGRMDENTPEESFAARSTVTADEDKLIIHVPNKRVYADLTLTLPERTYDYLSINTLNGKVMINELDVKDVYAKSTNGSIMFDKLGGTMLEAKGSNGSITVQNSQLKDLLASTVNGSLAYDGELESGDLSTTNGEVKVTVKNDSIARLKAATVNGNVKLAIPDNVTLEGQAKTTFGKIKSRLSNVEITDTSDNMKRFKRVVDETTFDFNISTTTGNVLLKDTDK